MIVTSEMFKKEGEENKFCPYYYPYQIKEAVDVIFMSYHYITDMSILPSFAEIIKNSIIIFDEAHNVPETVCNGRSFEVDDKTF
jgi:Rad3-related DNA helicase